MKPLRFSYIVVVVIFGFVLTACNVTPAANPTLPVHTTSARVNGKTETILTDSRGFALYYYTPDTSTTSACTNGCADVWPPLLRDSAKTALSTGSLPGTLTVQRTTNGNQVKYNGHLLYTYISDGTPGEVTGDNVNDWFVATPDLS